MRILVCVKQVPDAADVSQRNAQTGCLSSGRAASFRMNRFDEFAIEEALRIRDRHPGTVVHAISVGPERIVSTLRRALAMGADHGIHLVCPTEGWISPFTVASWIAAWARPRSYDLILTGVLAEDWMEEQVGPMVAEFLSIASATSVVSVTLQFESRTVQIERETEGGVREILRFGLPALVTIQSGINKPRYPSLSHVLRSHEQPVEVIPTASLGAPDPRQEILGFSFPPQARPVSLLPGTAQQKAEALVTLLRARSFLP